MDSRDDLSNWTNFLRKLPMLFLGLLLFSVGIIANLYSNLGMGPWGVLSVGLTNHTQLTLGQISQVTGLMVLILGWILGFPPGFATIMNMIFIGFFIDVVIDSGIFPQPDALYSQFLMLFFSIISLGIGSLFYLSPKLGAGPRDGLMMGLVQRFDRPVGEIRTAMEIIVLVMGYLLGGPVGIGTLVSALTVGYAIQLAFKLGDYDKMAPHMNLYTLVLYLRET
jgi:uncharacterized membrane protein YczE